MKPRAAEAHELYEQYVLMVRPQQGLKIYKVLESIYAQLV